MSIYFENKSGKTFSGAAVSMIERAAEAVLKDRNLNKNCLVNIVLVDSEEIRKINKKFRRIDNQTDVLSFPAYDNPIVISPEDEAELGDVVICHDRLLSQAYEIGHSVEREAAFLTVHSILHLLGYDHMEEKDEEIMTAAQRRIMKNIG